MISLLFVLVVGTLDRGSCKNNTKESEDQQARGLSDGTKVASLGHSISVLTNLDLVSC